LLVDVLAEAGVRQIYGVSGDSLNGITDSIRAKKQIQWIHLRHEETAAFAAGAEAHLTGGLAVCAGSCGPGNLHLINGSTIATAAAFPCWLSQHKFQAMKSEVDISGDQTRHLSRSAATIVNLFPKVEQMPRVLEIAMQTALSRRGVSVVAIPETWHCAMRLNKGLACIFPPPKQRCALRMKRSPRWRKFSINPIR